MGPCASVGLFPTATMTYALRSTASSSCWNTLFRSCARRSLFSTSIHLKDAPTPVPPHMVVSLSTLADLDGIPRRKLHIGNLPHGFEQGRLEELLKRKIGRTDHFLRLESEPRGTTEAAIVRMTDIVHARKAVEKNLKLHFEDRPLSISFSKLPSNDTPLASRVLLSPLPGTTTDHDLWAFCATQTALRGINLRDIRIRQSVRDTSRYIGVLFFASIEDAVRAYVRMMDEPLQLGGQELRAHFHYTHGADERPVREMLDPTRSLYFYHYHGTRKALEHKLKKWANGRVHYNLTFMKAPETGTDNGSGFIQFFTVNQATKALQQLRGTIVDGQVLKVHYANNANRTRP
ncbi:unnamed protein product [Mycena citricolor]|uniref:RRM domain-containing protein n=1 Tax=Mycena citricolor TaxID=2018698 RepID=A0AAD2H6Q3_9AGAR|nr:unnamed protein product [Mycena citricolor]CAK5269941.1 unnamed protein product [Mycena citricolor]